MPEISSGEVKSLFKSAVDYRSGQKSSLNPLKRFSGLKKDTVTFNDLYNEWVSRGSPEDQYEISDLLKDGFGYSEKDIKKIFSDVFGDSDPSGAAAEKLAAYIKKNDLTDEVLKFIEGEYRDTLFKTDRGMFRKDKVIYEDIRRIFELIQKEDRSARESVLKSKEADSLGRSRK